MDEAEFDKFADEYRVLHASNIAMSGEGPEYFSEYKVRDLAREYAVRCGSACSPSILDFGSGIGASVPFLRKYLPNAQITCLDVSTKSLAIGRARLRRQARFVHFDGITIPLPDTSVDIVFAACVFHHINEEEHLGILQEFRRVLVPKGMAIIFEHNPYNPLTVHAVNTCPFDENAKLIAARQMQKRLRAVPFRTANVRYRIFFPRRLSVLRPVEDCMTRLPLGAQYYVLAMKD